MSDPPQNGPYIVQNRTLGVSEQGRICMGRKKGLLGIPTVLTQLDVA
jgi:hypothetical protein